MLAKVNLRHLEEHPVRIDGEVTVAELDIDARDELVAVNHPLKFDLEVDRIEEALLVQGSLRMTLDCRCSRCLKPFPYVISLENWTEHLPLEGEDALAVVNDCVDLTGNLREDILLEFPQHPLCDQECKGLPTFQGSSGSEQRTEHTETSSSAWDELNKLKF